MLRIAAPTCLVVLLAASTAHADVKTYADAKLSIDLPSGWKSSTEDRTTVMTPPDGAAKLIIADVDSADFAAVEALVAKVGVTGPKWRDKGREKTVNGVKLQTLDGTGTVAGTEMRIAALIVPGPTGKRGLVLAVYATSTGQKTHQEALRKMMESIKPAK